MVQVDVYIIPIDEELKFTELNDLPEAIQLLSGRPGFHTQMDVMPKPMSIHIVS